MKIEIAQALREVEPGYLLGTITINKVMHHMEAIRAFSNNGMLEVWHPEDGESNNEERMDALQAYYDGHYHLTTFEGFEGQYAVVIFPYAD